MVEAGDPLMDAVGPVVARGGRIAIAILCQDQTVLRPAVIVDGKVEFVAALRGALKRDL